MSDAQGWRRELPHPAIDTEGGPRTVTRTTTWAIRNLKGRPALVSPRKQA
jgi:hypothetical protein